MLLNILDESNKKELKIDIDVGIIYKKIISSNSITSLKSFIVNS